MISNKSKQFIEGAIFAKYWIEGGFFDINYKDFVQIVEYPFPPYSNPEFSYGEKGSTDFTENEEEIEQIKKLYKLTDLDLEVLKICSDMLKNYVRSKIKEDNLSEQEKAKLKAEHKDRLRQLAQKQVDSLIKYGRKYV